MSVFNHLLPLLIMLVVFACGYWAGQIKALVLIQRSHHYVRKQRKLFIRFCDELLAHMTHWKVDNVDQLSEEIRKLREGIAARNTSG